MYYNCVFSKTSGKKRQNLSHSILPTNFCLICSHPRFSIMRLMGILVTGYKLPSYNVVSMKRSHQMLFFYWIFSYLFVIMLRWSKTFTFHLILYTAIITLLLIYNNRKNNNNDKNEPEIEMIRVIEMQLIVIGSNVKW